MSEPYELLFKFIAIGSAGTGKSCIIRQFVKQKFEHDRSHTIGVELETKIINVGGKCVKLQIWDTAGQERFKSVTKSYYRGAAAALLVYDITNRESFNSLANWLYDARTLAGQDVTILLVGNKKDMDDHRQVTHLEASQFAEENDLLFIETSAKTGESVEESFLKCSRTILIKLANGELDPKRQGSGVQINEAQSPVNSPKSTDCACHV